MHAPRTGFRRTMQFTQFAIPLSLHYCIQYLCTLTFHPPAEIAQSPKSNFLGATCRQGRTGDLASVYRHILSLAVCAYRYQGPVS